MKYTTAVFDLDGTLLDTTRDLALAVNHALAAFGMPTRPEKDIISFTGNGIVRLMELSVPEGTPDDLYEQVFAEFKRYYGDHALDHTEPYDGVPALIADLHAAGLKTAVVSNKADFAVQQIIDARMPGAFDAVLGECSSLVYIGDSEVDVATAAACGCPCVNVSWGFRTREELVAAGATTIVDTPDELRRVLLG